MFKVFNMTPEEAAKACHEWLKSKGVLDEHHDVAWPSAPSGYRGELVAVFTRSRVEAEKSTAVYSVLECYEHALHSIAGTRSSEVANPRMYAADALKEGARLLGRTDGASQ